MGARLADRGGRPHARPGAVGDARRPWAGHALIARAFVARPSAALNWRGDAAAPPPICRPAVISAYGDVRSALVTGGELRRVLMRLWSAHRLRRPGRGTCGRVGFRTVDAGPAAKKSGASYPGIASTLGAHAANAPFGATKRSAQARQHSWCAPKQPLVAVRFWADSGHYLRRSRKRVANGLFAFGETGTPIPGARLRAWSHA